MKHYNEPLPLDRQNLRTDCEDCVTRIFPEHFFYFEPISFTVDLVTKGISNNHARIV